MEIGEEQSDDQLNQTLKKVAINQCCTIVYTVSFNTPSNLNENSTKIFSPALWAIQKV